MNINSKHEAVLYGYNVRAVGTAASFNPHLFETFKKAVKGDDGSELKVDKTIGNHSFLLLKRPVMNSYRSQLLKMPHTTASTYGNGRETDALHIQDVMNKEAECNAAIYAESAAIVAVPREERLQEVYDDVYNFMKQHNYGDTAAAAAASAAKAHYPSDEKILLAHLEVSYWEITKDIAIAPGTPEEIAKSIQESASRRYESAAGNLLADYCNAVLEPLLTIAKQGIDGLSVKPQTLQSYTKKVEDLRAANATVFNSPAVRCFLDGFAVNAVDSETYRNCAVDGFIRLFYEAGMSDQLPVDTFAATLGYTPEWLEIIGTDPSQHNSFMELYEAMGCGDSDAV